MKVETKKPLCIRRMVEYTRWIRDVFTSSSGGIPSCGHDAVSLKSACAVNARVLIRRMLILGTVPAEMLVGSTAVAGNWNKRGGNFPERLCLDL